MPATIKENLRHALNYHQAGDLDQAERLYRDVLRVDPHHADALHLIGVTCYQRSNHEQAVDFIRRAIAINEDASPFFCNLGVAFHAMELFDDAVENFHDALKLDPGNANAHFNLGKTYEALGRTDDAIQSYLRTLSVAPDYYHACNNLGKLYSTRENHEEAEKYFREVVRLCPDFEKGHYNLANGLMKQKRYAEAAPVYETALRLSPETAEFHSNFGTALKELGRFSEASSYFQKAVELAPEFYQAINNLGAMHQYFERYDEAMTCYERSLILRPEFAGARTNLANIHNDNGDLDLAIQGFSRVIESGQDFAEAHFNRSLARIRKGEFAAGWAEYEWRWIQNVQPRHFPLPEWDGTSLESKTILIYAEQGIGDEVMFASCVPDVLASAKHVVVECDPRLRDVFAGSFPGASVVPRPVDSSSEVTEMMGAVDLQIAMGSIPRLLRLRESDFPQRSNYLSADSNRVIFWRERLQELGPGVKVGISWRGGGDRTNVQRRSTILEQWHDALSLPSVQFVNLQYGETRDELNSYRDRSGITIHDWDDVDPLKNLNDFAAQISALDLVISVDNSTVHMAGALGVEVWTLLPFASDWRWLMNRDDSPWYPSMRLFRQQERGDWKRVFHRVSHSLRKKIENNVVSREI